MRHFVPSLFVAFCVVAAACGDSVGDGAAAAGPDASGSPDGAAPGEPDGSAPDDAGVLLVPHLHAHNDYEHPRPLFDALDRHFDSVEADIHESAGQLEVSHDTTSTKGTLAALYLDPLASRVAATGSVYGDGKPFYLWVDLKEDTPALKSALVAELAKYDFLTQFTDAAEVPKAVTVVLTGSAAKVALVTDTPAPRRFIRDSNDFAESDPAADTRWGYYALQYIGPFSWDGQGTIPTDQLAKLKTLVAAVHEKGRKLRFYAAPESAAFVHVARDTGVDFIGGDDLASLAASVATR